MSIPLLRPLLVFLLLVGTAHAQVPDPVVSPDSLAAWSAEEERVEEPLPSELTFIGYSFTRFTASNVTPTNDILQGQVIGRLFGPNSTQTVDRVANYTEQRFVPLFVYRPNILDGYATFRSLFKIDYTWGDQAYVSGNNRGGALNAGAVNLQTLMANVEIRPPGASWNAVVGLQRIFDGARDPNVNTLDSFFQSGYKLAYWGTQGVGLTSYLQLSPATRARVGVYQLWENLVARDDDVVLGMVDVEHLLTPRLLFGADVWYVYDHAEGAGGISVLGQGLNSLLAAYNGATQLALPRNYNAQLFWFGTRAQYNYAFATGPWWWDAFAIANVGSATAEGLDDVNILGLAANARAAYQYGRTVNDYVSLEGLYTTGDDDGIADGTVNSVITGNVYGSPVGIYTSGRALLLFPDPQVVNRYYSAVHDISNLGLGVTGLFANVSYDVVPNRFAVKFGGATAFANTDPIGGGRYMGTEANVELTYNLKVFLTLGLHAGYVFLGDFYDAPASVYDPPGQPPNNERPDNPWVVFTTLSWLMF